MSSLTWSWRTGAREGASSLEVRFAGEKIDRKVNWGIGTKDESNRKGKNLRTSNSAKLLQSGEGWVRGKSTRKGRGSWGKGEDNPIDLEEISFQNRQLGGVNGT